MVKAVVGLVFAGYPFFEVPVQQGNTCGDDSGLDWVVASNSFAPAADCSIALSNLVNEAPADGHRLVYGPVA